MQTIWDILYLRRPVLNYACPPICEAIFSGSGQPVIVLADTALGKVTGIAIGGFGGFQLTWNAFPGALCYNVYFIGGDNVAVLLAQCISDTSYVFSDLGPGQIVITAITLDGETPPSDPFPAPAGGGGTSTVNVEALRPMTSRASFPGTFRIFRPSGDTAGNLTVNFVLSGSASNGVDYEPVPLSAVILHGTDEVIVEIVPVEEALLTLQGVTMTLTPSGTYTVGTSNTAVVSLRPPILRIVGYGTSEPLFTPAPSGGTTDFPGLPAEGSEWDGTFNDQSVGGILAIFQYQDSAGSLGGAGPSAVPLAETVQGTAMLWAVVQGPYASSQWRLVILGRLTDGSQYIIWSGTAFQTPGDPGPVRTYTAVGGFDYPSDTRPTITLEYAPA